MNFAFLIRPGADLPVIRRNTAEEPFTVPQNIAAACSDLFGKGSVVFGIVSSPQGIRQLTEAVQSPEMQEADHCALSPAEIQAVIPVRPQTLANAVLSDLSGGKIKDARQMFIDAALPSVGISDRKIDKGQFSRLFDILYHGRNQP